MCCFQAIGVSLVETWFWMSDLVNTNTSVFLGLICSTHLSGCLVMILVYTFRFVLKFGLFRILKLWQCGRHTVVVVVCDQSM